MAQFDADAARAAGYSEEEIQSYLERADGPPPSPGRMMLANALPVAGGIAGGVVGLGAGGIGSPIGAGLGTMAGMEGRRLMLGEQFDPAGTMTGGALGAVGGGGIGAGKMLLQSPAVKRAITSPAAKGLGKAAMRLGGRRAFGGWMDAAEFGRDVFKALRPAADEVAEAAAPVAKKAARKVKAAPPAAPKAASAPPQPNPKATAETMARKQRGASKRVLEQRQQGLAEVRAKKAAAAELKAVPRAPKPVEDDMTRRLQLSRKLEQEMTARGLTPLQKLEARRAIQGRMSEFSDSGVRTLSLSPMLTMLLRPKDDKKQ